MGTNTFRARFNSPLRLWEGSLCQGDTLLEADADIIDVEELGSSCAPTSVDSMASVDSPSKRPCDIYLVRVRLTPDVCLALECESSASRLTVRVYVYGRPLTALQQARAKSKSPASKLKDVQP